MPDKDRFRSGSEVTALSDRSVDERASSCVPLLAADTDTDAVGLPQLNTCSTSTPAPADPMPATSGKLGSSRMSACSPMPAIALDRFTLRPISLHPV